MKWLESPFELVNSLVYTLVDSPVNKFPQVLVADSLHQTTFVKRFWEIHDNRSLTTCASDMESFLHNAWDIINVLHRNCAL